MLPSLPCTNWAPVLYLRLLDGDEILPRQGGLPLMLVGRSPAAGDGPSFALPCTPVTFVAYVKPSLPLIVCILF